MSAVDVIFGFVYLLCGLVVGAVFARNFGPWFAFVGFVLGIACAMIAWRCFAAFCFPRKRARREQSEAAKKEGI